MIEKRRRITESAAPCANEIASCAYPETSLGPDRVGQVVELLLELDPLEAVVVEPQLEAVDVRSRRRSCPVAAFSSVKYASIRSAAERVSVDDDACRARRATRRTQWRRPPTRRRRRRPRGSRRRVRSRTSGLSVNAITAAVRNRKARARASREQEGEEQEHGQADELDPPRDRIARSSVSRSDRSPARGARSSREARSRVRYRGANGLAALPASGAPARTQAPRTTARPPSRRCSPCSRALGVVTLLFTAFGSSGSSTGSRRRSRSTPSPSPTPPPSGRGRQVLASIGNLRIQLPVAAGAAHRDRVPRLERRIALAPAGRPPGERGAARAAVAAHRGERPRLAALVPARGWAGRHERARRRRRARAPTSTRRSRARSSRSATS